MNLLKVLMSQVKNLLVNKLSHNLNNKIKKYNNQPPKANRKIYKIIWMNLKFSH
jgi:hypothetical protein